MNEREFFFFLVGVEKEVEVEKRETHRRFSSFSLFLFRSYSLSLPFFLSLASHIIQQQSTAVPQRMWFILLMCIEQKEREIEW